MKVVDSDCNLSMTSFRSIALAYEPIHDATNP